MKTREIKVNQLWPGMILTDHTYRGRIADITSCNDHGQVRVTFDDVFEGYTLNEGASVSIIDN